MMCMIMFMRAKIKFIYKVLRIFWDLDLSYYFTLILLLLIKGLLFYCRLRFSIDNIIKHLLILFSQVHLFSLHLIFFFILLLHIGVLIVFKRSSHQILLLLLQLIDVEMFFIIFMINISILIHRPRRLRKINSENTLLAKI